MKVTYDERTDTLVLTFQPDVAVEESDEDHPGMIMDLDRNGNVVSIEVLDASQRVADTRRVDFTLLRP